MGKRTFESPSPETEIKRIKTEFGEFDLVNIKTEFIEDTRQDDTKSEWFREVPESSIDGENSENLGYAVQGFMDQNMTNQELLELMPNIVCHDEGDEETVYLIQDVDEAADFDSVPYANDAENVPDDETVSQAENSNEIVLRSKLILANVDIGTKIIGLITLMQSQGIIGNDTVIRDILLQDVQPLDPDKSLASQCISAKCRAKVAMELRSFGDGSISINIVDIFKDAVKEKQDRGSQRIHRYKKQEKQRRDDGYLKFVVSEEFAQMKAEFDIPDHYNDWTTEHVQLWLEWASHHFDLSPVNIPEVTLTGSDLNIMETEFMMNTLGVTDPMFSLHVNVLKQGNLIALADTSDFMSTAQKVSSGRGNRTGNNGQVQLWQFLLELLIDSNYKEIITWDTKSSLEGAFLIQDQSELARLWGERKNKQNMTYEKMSRAVRYYYENNLIKKLSGKKYGYQFVCDLKQMIGFSASEIQRIQECPVDLLTGTEQSQLQELKEALRTPGCIKKVVQPTDADVLQTSTDVVHVQEMNYFIPGEEVTN